MLLQTLPIIVGKVQNVAFILNIDVRGSLRQHLSVY